MTDPRRRSRAGDLAVPVTTAAVAAGAAAAVAWAAATPVQGATAPAPVPAPVDHSAAISATKQQIEALQQSIAATRRTLRRVASTRIPRVAGSGATGASSVPAYRAPTTTYVAPAAPAAAPAPAPATHTTTGASGAPH